MASNNVVKGLADHFVGNGLFLPPVSKDRGGLTVAVDRFSLLRAGTRRGFTVIFDELWTTYLPHVGPQAVLLYCFLQYLAGSEIPNPCSDEWGAQVCKPLGMTIAESHQAWARLQEMGLLVPVEQGYALCDPNPISQAKQEADRKMLGDLEALFGRPLSMTEITLAQELEDAYGGELVLAAAAVAVEVHARSMPYIRQVLLNWQAKGISTVEQAQYDTAEYRREKARRHARRGDRPKKTTSVMPASPATSISVTYDESEIVLRRIKKAEAEERVSGDGY